MTLHHGLVGVLLAGIAITAGAESVNIGTGDFLYDTPALARPFSRDAGRYQILILAEQIEDYAGRELVAVAFDAINHPSEPAKFANVKIRVAHTPLKELTHAFNDNYGGNTPAEALNETELTFDWTERGWHQIAFSQPVKYDGKQNLVIEFQHNGNDENVAVRTTRWAHDPGRVLDGTLTSGVNEPRRRDSHVQAGHLRNYFNDFRLIFAEEQ